MTAVVKCDGPGCEVTMDPNNHERRLCDPGWLEVREASGVSHDFHDIDCVAKWAGGEVDLTELRRAWDTPPHTAQPVADLINVRLAREWPALVTALNRLLGT